jgi:hypothetical protein
MLYTVPWVKKELGIQREVPVDTIGWAADKVQIPMGGVAGTPRDLAFIVVYLNFPSSIYYV